MTGASLGLTGLALSSGIDAVLSCSVLAQVLTSFDLFGLTPTKMVLDRSIRSKVKVKKEEDDGVKMELNAHNPTNQPIANQIRYNLI